MPYSTAAFNAMLDNLGTLVTHVSLHTADPGTAGTSEVTGGTPAYARKTATWSAAAAGIKNLSNAPVFDVPTGTTVLYVGYWGALTAGTWYGSSTITAATFTTQNTYTLDDANLELVN